MATRMSELDPIEISLVGKGANKRKFLVLKEDGMTKEQIQELMKKVDPAILAKADTIIKKYVKKDGATPASQLPATGKGVSPQAEAALKAVVRILTPFKDEINDALLDDVLVGSGVLGAGEPGGKTMAEKGMEKPDDVSDEMHEKAMKAATATYKHAIAKLGSRKYPDAEMELKSAGYVHKDAGDLPPKADSHVYKDAITKADGTLDVEKIPENMRAAVTALWSQNKELVTKSESNAKQLETERKERRMKEMVAKAEGFKNFAGDKKALAEQLVALQDANPELYKTTITNLELVEKSAAEATKLHMGELGTDLPMPSGVAGAQGEAGWSNIEKAAETYVAKSGDGGKISKEQAVEKFLTTKEGQQMYRDYKAGRPNGI